MLRKKQIRTEKRKLNTIFSAFLFGTACTLAGFGSKQACTDQTMVSALQMPVSAVFCQIEAETGQAVLSAFRQNASGQDNAEQTGETADTQTASVAESGLQDQKTVSGNTISEQEVRPETELDIELEKVFEQVNQARREVGQTELVWSDELADAAGIRAKEIHASFSHTRPDGSEWWSVNEEIVYGENLAKGYQNADSVMKAWLDSTEHKDNILYSGFQSIGIAIYEVDGKWYWAQEFGY